MAEPTIKNLEIPTRIEKCCDSGSISYAINSVRMIRESNTEATLYATDGRCMAATNVAAEHIDANHAAEEIPTEAIPKRANTSKRNYRLLSLNGRWENGNNKIVDAVHGAGRFPRIGKVLPDISDHSMVTIDCKLLAQIAAAITNVGDEQLITLCVQDSESAIAVIGANGVGVLMPCSQYEKKVDKHAVDIKRYNEYRDRAKKTDFNPLPTSPAVTNEK